MSRVRVPVVYNNSREGEHGSSSETSVSVHQRPRAAHRLTSIRLGREARPPRTPMSGRLCRLEPLQASRHAEALHEEYSADREGRNWTYLRYGPFASAEEYAAWVRSVETSEDPMPRAPSSGSRLILRIC